MLSGAAADLPDGARILAAVRATWPPSRLDRVGPFDLPAEREGTGRATSARLCAGTVPTAADLAAVEAVRPGTAFCAQGDDDALIALLSAQGYVAGSPAVTMAGPVAPLLGDPPPVSGVPHWPPVAICGAIWDAHGNGSATRAPADRAPEPKAAILLRLDDRAAGALFVACDGDVAVLHMVVTLQRFRRRGAGLLGMRHAAVWAQGHGARYLALPVEADNAPARALYARAGLIPRGGYRYWSLP